MADELNDQGNVVDADPAEGAAERAALEEKERKRQDDLLLERAFRQFRVAEDAETRVRAEMLEDQRFRTGGDYQWPTEILQVRRESGRPCHTINRVPQFIRQVTNQERQTRPAIQINPVGDGADVETAQMLQGLCRHTELASQADVAYDTAGDQQATTGRGVWRVITEYVDELNSDDQEARIEAVENQFSVYKDPTARKPDGRDARYAFIFEDLSEDEYKLKYPDSQLASLIGTAGIGNASPEWASRSSIRVAEYFYAEETKVRVVHLRDGRVGPSTTFTDEELSADNIVSERSAIKRQIKWALINAVEVLERRDWPGQYIPIVEIFGDRLNVDGKLYVAGVVRDLKEPQRQYNVWSSALTEAIQLAPISPILVAEGQIDDYKEMWAKANRMPYAYLVWKPTTLNGQPVGPPRREAFEPNIGPIMAAVRQAEADMKGSTGIYDDALGQRGPSQSGKAILARQGQSEVATSHYMDNLKRGIAFTGLILLDIFPKIIDAPRAARILNEDQTIGQVGILNRKQFPNVVITVRKPDGFYVWSDESKSFEGPVEQPPEGAVELPAAVERLYDIGTGRYDVTVNVGPSQQSKRTEAVTSMLSLVQAYPNIMPIAGDLVVGEMDWPGAKPLSERLRKALPPGLADDENADDKAKPEQLQAQMQMMAQQIEAVTQQLNAATDTIERKQIEGQQALILKRMELESRERTVAIQTQAQLVGIQAKLESAEAMTVLREQLADMRKRLDLLHTGLSLEQEPGGGEMPPPAAQGQPPPTSPA